MGSTNGLVILNGEVTRQASMLGYVNIFSWMALGTCILFPLILWLRPAKPVTGALPEAHGE